MSCRSSGVGIAVAGLCLLPGHALAEAQISVFGGLNTVFGSTVTLDSPTAGNDRRSIDWEGSSFDMPPYWGVRGTYWLNPNWGVAIDFTHAKAAADLDFDDDDTYDRLEFTDGNNLLLVNLLYRFHPMLDGALVPYAGAGIGVAIPHVEVTLDADADNETYEYQLTGFAAQILGGLEYKLNPSWSLFGEARLSYSHISADLEGGGSLETDLWSPQLAIGITYRFPGN